MVRVLRVVPGLPKRLAAPQDAGLDEIFNARLLYPFRVSVPAGWFGLPIFLPSGVARIVWIPSRLEPPLFNKGGLEAVGIGSGQVRLSVQFLLRGTNPVNHTVGTSLLLGDIVWGV